MTDPTPLGPSGRSGRPVTALSARGGRTKPPCACVDLSGVTRRTASSSARTRHDAPGPRPRPDRRALRARARDRHRRRPDRGRRGGAGGRRRGRGRRAPARQGAPARHRQRALPHVSIAPARPRRRPRLHGLARPRALPVLDPPRPRGHLPGRGLRLRGDAAARRHDLRGLLLPPGRGQCQCRGRHPGGAGHGHPAGARAHDVRLGRGARPLSRGAARRRAAGARADRHVRGRPDRSPSSPRRTARTAPRPR